MPSFDYEKHDPQEILCELQFEYPEAPWEEVENDTPEDQIAWLFKQIPEKLKDWKIYFK